MSGRLDVFKQAVQLSVEGDRVTLESVKGPEGEEFHVIPRKLSKKHAAKLRKLLMQSSTAVKPSLQAKIRKIKKEHGDDITEDVLAAELDDEDMAALMNATDPDQQYEIERAKILYGIAEQDLSDEPGPMTEDIAELILESREVTDEVLGAVDDLNPPFGQETSS